MDTRNLTEENADDLQGHLEEMKVSSPEIEYEKYDIEKDGKSMRQQLDEIAEIMGDILIKLDYVFKNHVLINGKWVDIKDKEE